MALYHACTRITLCYTCHINSSVLKSFTFGLKEQCSHLFHSPLVGTDIKI